MTANKKKLFPNQRKTFKNISLSRNTIQNRIADFSEDVFDQLKEITNEITYFLLAIDESTDYRHLLNYWCLLELLLTLLLFMKN